MSSTIITIPSKQNYKSCSDSKSKGLDQEFVLKLEEFSIEASKIISPKTDPLQIDSDIITKLLHTLNQHTLKENILSKSKLEILLCHILKAFEKEFNKKNFSEICKNSLIYIISNEQTSSTTLCYILSIFINYIDCLSSNDISKIIPSAKKVFQTKSVQYKIKFIEFLTQTESHFPGFETVDQIYKEIAYILYSDDIRLKISMLKFLAVFYRDLHSKYSIDVQSLCDKIVEMFDHPSLEVKINALECLKILCTQLTDCFLEIDNEICKFTPVTGSDFLFLYCCYLLNCAEEEIKSKSMEIILQLKSISERFSSEAMQKRIFHNLIDFNQNRRNKNIDVARLSTFTSKTGPSFLPNPLANMDIKIYKTCPMNALVNCMDSESNYVQSLTIQCLRHLCKLHQSCRPVAMNLILDCLDDDDHIVRLEALTGLEELGNNQRLFINASELVNIISLCIEKSSKIRQKVRKCFSLFSFSTPNCILKIFDALKESLVLYPDDFLQILSCLKCLSKNNQLHVSFIYDEIMQLNPHFNNVEPNVDDKIYVMKFILVVNCRNIHNELESNMPKYFKDHFIFFNSAYKEYMPFNEDLLMTFDAKREKLTSRLNLDFDIFANCLNLLKNISSRSNIDASKLHELLNLIQSIYNLTPRKENGRYLFFLKVVQFQVYALTPHSNENSNPLLQIICILFSSFWSDNYSFVHMIILNLIFQYMHLFYKDSINPKFYSQIQASLSSKVNDLLGCGENVDKNLNHSFKKSINNLTKDFSSSISRLTLLMLIKCDKIQLNQTLINNFSASPSNCDKNGDVFFIPQFGTPIDISFDALNSTKEFLYLINISFDDEIGNINYSIDQNDIKQVDYIEKLTIEKKVLINFDVLVENSVKIHFSIINHTSLNHILKKLKICENINIYLPDIADFSEIVTFKISESKICELKSNKFL